jgi:hypothetical protein
VPTNGQPRCGGAATVIDRKTLACKQFRLVAAGPCGVPAAVPEAGLVAHQHLTRAEAVAVRASGGRVDDPLPGRRLYQLAQHGYKPIDDAVEGGCHFSVLQ